MPFMVAVSRASNTTFPYQYLEKVFLKAILRDTWKRRPIEFGAKRECVE
jgi:hypothetical protein